jgi:ssDNA-binding Zn-finger/Zn-ribbon topoisomerase 1
VIIKYEELYNVISEMIFSDFDIGEYVNIKCTNENCNGQLIVRDGKYGRFFGCSDYPNCKKTNGIVSYVKSSIPIITGAKLRGFSPPCGDVSDYIVGRSI